MSTMRVTNLKHENSASNNIVLNSDGSVGGELATTLASKPTFSYGTATPTADADGAIWYDENDTPPTPKFWDGSAWQPFSAGVGNAVITSPAATGSYSSGGVTYNYYTFTSSGSITVADAGDGVGGFVDLLIVGGGGGGGGAYASNGGGGGAGGVVQVSGGYLPAGTHTVTVGAGGPKSVSSTNNYYWTGRSGQGSAVGPYSAAGGGGGGGWVYNNGTGYQLVAGGHGGSGGGSSGVIGGGGLGTPGQGNNGRNAGGGGGGGAGAAATSSTGGAGVTVNYTGSNITVGKGGNGGSAGGDGTANTGNGGNAGRATGTNSGAGGSGLVIVRVAT